MRHIIIVGTGIVGSTAAYLLAKNKQKVTMIDATFEGRATSAGAGIIAPWANQRRNKAWYTLAKNGAAYYPTLISMLAADGLTNTSYRKIGSLQLYQDEKKLHKMYDIVYKKRLVAPEIGQINMLNEHDTKNQFPYVADGYSSLHIEGAACVDGNTFRNTLIDGAISHGATYIEGVATIQDEHTIQVNSDSLTADHIVLTNGVWMRDTLTSLGIKTNFYMQKGQLIHVQFPHIKTNEFPMINIPSDPYIVPFPDGRIVIGATREDDVPMDANHSLQAIFELLEKTFTFAPGFKSCRLLDVKTGFRPYTPSFIPAFGTIPTKESMFFVNGLGSSGLTTGPYIGKTITSMILQKAIHIDLAPYSIEPYIQ